MANNSFFGKAVAHNAASKQVTIEISRDRKQDYPYEGLATDAIDAALNKTKNWIVTDGVITKVV